MDLADFFMELEKEFGIEIPDSDAESLTIIIDCVNYLHSKIPTHNNGGGNENPQPPTIVEYEYTDIVNGITFITRIRPLEVGSLVDFLGAPIISGTFILGDGRVVTIKNNIVTEIKTGVDVVHISWIDFSAFLQSRYHCHITRETHFHNDLDLDVLDCWELINALTIRYQLPGPFAFETSTAGALYTTLTKYAEGLKLSYRTWIVSP